MARLFDDASTEYLSIASAAVTAVPVTMACWFNTDTLTINENLVSVSVAAGWHYFLLGAAGAATLDRVIADTNGAETSAYAETTSAFSANTWHHGCAVWSATNSRAAYIDGGSKGTNATTITPTGIDTTTIGVVRLNSTGYGYTSGMVAEAAIWNVALTDAEVAILAKGYSPLLVRPQSLVCYWPLIRDEDQDRVGGYNLTDYNTPSIADHPPKVRYAVNHHLGKPSAVAAARRPRHNVHYNELFVY